MDPVIEQLYTTLMPAAPYVIGAYLLIWGVLVGALIGALRRCQQLMRRVDLLEHQLMMMHRKQHDASETTMS